MQLIQAYILALFVFEKPKNFSDMYENLNIRFCLAFSQSWFSNHKMYFGFSLLHCTCLTLTEIKVSGWKKNYERHFPVKWWPFERLNGLYKLYFVHECNE